MDWLIVQSACARGTRQPALAGYWLVDQAQHRITLVAEGYLRAETKRSGQERFGPVDRVEMPAPVCVWIAVGKLLALDAMLRINLFYALAHHSFHFAVGDGHGAVVPLRIYRRPGAEVAFDDGPCLIGHLLGKGQRCPG
ncbi:hypothetical protein D9M69_499730 [compost metagenome]